MAPSRKSSAWERFSNRLANYDVVEAVFARKPPPSPPRSIYVNQDLPQDAFNHKQRVKKEYVYVTNQVITSKYTIFTFIPRNLLEQFRRIANIFFAAIAILQFFPKFSTISPGLVILPLLGVLAVTALKDGYEDVKRHQSDYRVNHTPARILAGGDWVNPNVTAAKAKTFLPGLPTRKSKKVGVTVPEPSGGEALELQERQPSVPSIPPLAKSGSSDEVDHPEDVDPESEDYDPSKAHWKRTIWEDVRVGDFVLLRSDEPIPADIVICSTSEPEQVAFIETKNLDGETNLKSRNAVPELAHLRLPHEIIEGKGHGANTFRIDIGEPEVNMYRLNATLTWASGEKHPIDLQTVLLRGTILRNTNWVVGVVLFTGTDTKIVMNSGGTPSKRSKVERQMNPQVFINLVLLAVMAVVCAIVDSVLEKRAFAGNSYWTFGEGGKGDNPSINGLVTFANALITFQNVVPISLYLSIEAVRTCQAAFIYFDSQIWYEKTDTATLARSWNLSDDLGQIEYVFSDKTGTLTQNAMIFRQCSIGGKVYKGDDVPDPTPADRTVTKSPSSSSSRSPGYEKTDDPSSSTLGQSPTPPSSTHRFYDSGLMEDIRRSMNDSENDKEFQVHSRNLNGFFATLSLCHTVIAAHDRITGAIEYRAQSPDEAALVQAAADVGFVFMGREKGTHTLKLKTPFSETLEEYDLLNLLDFTSARKRMSVIVRKMDENDKRVFLLCKGADSVIFERLKAGQDDMKDKTGKDLEHFARDGLRTLCLAYKVIPDDEYEAWNEEYHDATTALEDREEKIEAVCDRMERDLRLLGATAIEDKLQDGVPETIASLKQAGIKVWVATGDKLETAIAIGQSTNLIARESNIIVVRGGEFGTSKSAYSQMQDAVEQFFPNSGIFDQEDVVPPTGLRRSSSLTRSRTSFNLRRVGTGLSDIIGRENGDRPGGFVLVIDGKALTHALEEPFSKELLLQLSTRCEAVICCRVSPIQKAHIVRLIKDGLGVMTLAIGDGANDVSMIQAADVGVGISGEEGLQAVNSSDYAIAQFRYLKRLLFVHGHWSYLRNSNMILNFFYKNIVGIGVLWWFQIYCGWSTQYVFEYTYLLFWNVFWSIAPVIAIGLFDRNVDDDILMALPPLYRYGREGRWFGSGVFTIYMLDGIYQSAVVFFFVFYTYATTTPRKDGWEIGMYEFSTVMVMSAVMAVNAFNGLNTHAWTGWVWFSVFFGVVLIWLYTAIYSVISPGWFVTYIFGNDWFLFHSAYFWLCLPLTISLAVLPRYLAKAFKFNYIPDDIDVVRWVRKMEPHRDIAHDPQLGGHFLISPHDEDDEDDTPGPRPRSRLGRMHALDARGSTTDMSTGLHLAPSRGFDFDIEEGGVAIRRMQTDLSERSKAHRSGLKGRRRGASLSLFPGLRQSIRKRLPKSPPSSPPR
ncbi:hypothetical protein BOTBODRAFT_39791 [Botryobasidium botryosum FD-172 SS1]|uniref:Phospholipid-transporting ATPase n=1 Tax=Botryobasidium botryosum (strain FD-172 SS1) TaxID=930990 RepID=A0A067LV61_BOTB1|nr:hypothetical protein BOTBODRAFT_39791 [Botryobasidium botryosum FD-172 SS1]